MIKPLTKKVGDLIFTFYPGSGKVPTNGRLTINKEDETIDTDSFNIAKKKSRDEYIGRLKESNPALVTTESCDDIKSCLLDFASKDFASIGSSIPDKTPAEVTSLLDTIPQEIFESAWKMLQSDDLFEQIAKDIEDIGVTGETPQNITIYVIMTSRYLDDPLAVIVMGCSSSGKSYKIERIATLIPPQEKVQAHDFTPQVLSRLPEGSLKHKVVICGERLHDNFRGKEGHAQDNTKAFREMLSSKRYSRMIVEPNKDTGKHEVVYVDQEGPIAYLESTTASYIPDEDSTRMIKLATDETEEQTGRIQDLQKLRIQGPPVIESKRDEIILKHQVLQTILTFGLLESPQVYIPFINHVTLPNKIVSTRRTFPFVASIIQTVAFLRQFHPSKIGDTTPDWGNRKKERLVIVADKEDYRIAYPLIQSVLEKTYGSLPSIVRGMLNTIIEKTRKIDESITLSDGRKTIPNDDVTWLDFTSADCEEWVGIKKTEVWRRLNSLTLVGILSRNDNSKPYKYKIINPDLAKEVDIIGGGLPTPDAMDELIEQDNLRREEKDGGTFNE